MDYTKYLAGLVLWVIFLSAKVHSDGNFEIFVTFVSYHTDGKLPNGHCCDNWPLCTNDCDFKFKICLDSGPARGNMRINSNNCNYGFYETNVVKKNHDSLDFDGNMGGLTNPIQIDVTGPVSGRFLLEVEIKDHDGISNSDFMDFLSQEIIAEKDVETTYELSRGTDLTVKTLLRCKEHWHGNGCDEFCPPAPHDNYVCDPSTGHRTCALGWRGPLCDDRYKIHEDEP